MSETTSEQCLKAAFQALLKGDTKERDRLCDRAKELLKAEQHAATIQQILNVDFFVFINGQAVSSKTMARAAGEIQ